MPLASLNLVSHPRHFPSISCECLTINAAVLSLQFVSKPRPWGKNIDPTVKEDLISQGHHTNVCKVANRDLR